MRDLDPLALVVPVAGALVAASAAAVLWRFSVDDAYITYRVAENIARGQGYAYNPGVPRQVSTTPLWTLLLAACARMGVAVPDGARALSVAALFGAAGAAGFIPGPVRGPAAAVAGAGPSRLRGRAAAAACYLFVTTSVMLLSCIGMETGLYLLLAAATTALALGRRYAAAGGAAGLLVLARADGLLLVAILAAIATARRDLPAWRALPPLVLVGAAWTAWCCAYFGDPLPVTLAAKVAQGRSGYWGEGAIHLRGAARWLGGLAGEQPGLWLVPPLAAFGLWRGPAGPRILALFGAAVTAAYAALGVPDYHWYYAPLAFGLLVTAAWGAALLPGRALPALAMAVVVLSQGRALAARLGRFPPAALVDYEAAGKILGRDAGRTLASAEIGVLGYASGLPVHDWLGLADGAGVRLLAARRLDLFLERVAPDTLLVHEPLWPVEEPLFHAEEARRYGLKHVFPGRAGTLVALARGGPPAHGPVVALGCPCSVKPGAPVELPFVMDPRQHGFLRVEASAGPPGARLSIWWTTRAHREMREPYRAEIELPGDGAVHQRDVPVAGDGRFLAFGPLDRVRLEVAGADVMVTAFAAGGGP